MTVTRPTALNGSSLSFENTVPFYCSHYLVYLRRESEFEIMAERVVNSANAVIAGVSIPRGTIVAMNNAGLNTNPNIWSPDVEIFRPERWLEASEEQRVLMHRADLTFSAGKRMCLGLNVAWLEMKKVIPALIMNFEFSCGQAPAFIVTS